VPPDPGNLSAYGLLTVDVRNDYVRTYVARQDRIDLARVEQTFGQLREEADAALAREGFAAADRRFVRSADVRYYGQAFEVRVEVADGPVTDELVRQVAAAFAAEHRRLYGYDLSHDPRQQVEWVNLRVTGIGPIRRPAVRTAPVGHGSQGACIGTRPAWFDRWTEAALYDRARLGSGDVVAGPAVIEEYGATVPVHPGYRARVDEHANLRLTRDN
jgi:N-methylhydantoinase A